MRDALGSVQSVLVLGGSSDIASATALKLAGRQAKTIVLAGRNSQSMKGRAQALRDAGTSKVEAVEFDAVDLDGHESFVDEIFKRFGDFDVVLMAFGVLGEQAQAEDDQKAALEIVTTNYLGAVSVAIPLVRKLKAQGHGVLVVLSSVAAERARKSNYIYGSSKAGLDAFFQGLGDSLDGSGVKVMVVRPGWVHSKMTTGLKPAPMSTTPDAVADAIVGGLDRGAHTVWVPAALRWLMFAVRHVPRPIFRRLNF